MLLEIGEKCGSGLSRKAGETLDQGLTDFSMNYTMQSEHDVHEATQSLAGAAAAVLGEQPDSPDRDAEELGANVEFF